MVGTTNELIAAEKRRVRAEMRVIRARVAADPADRAARSARIWAQIVSLPLPRRVMLFDSLPGEPDTSGWIGWCHAHGHEVFQPTVDGLELRVMPGDVDPTTLDIVIVPGLAFTPDGRRLGQGGGHFDRFLPRLRANCRTVGVCFAEQLVDQLPTSPHDVHVDRVVTDRVQA
jgi:5-formyltetrahydrofolate cyclo-ligase